MCMCVCGKQRVFVLVLGSCGVQTVGEATPRLRVQLDTQLSARPVSLQRLSTKGADRACVRARHRRFSCSAALTYTRYTKARSVENQTRTVRGTKHRCLRDIRISRAGPMIIVAL